MNTLSEIDFDLLRLKPSKVVGKMGMRVMDISYEDKPLVITLRNVIVPFEPSVYNGTGTEKRKGIVFSIDSAELAGFQQIEQVCQERMDKPGLWASSTKPEGTHSASLKAKVLLPGTHFFDVEGGQTDPPESWRRLKVNAALKIKAVYQTKQCSGLMIEAYAIQYDPQDTAEPTIACPF